MSASPRRVVMVVFARTKLLDVTGPLQVFADARLSDGRSAYRTQLVSVRGGEVMTDAGIALMTKTMSSAEGTPVDTLLVSGGDSALEAAKDPALQHGIARLARGTRRLGSICSGAFVLARGGHLHGKRAATHWEYAAEFATAFPEIALHPDSIYEVDGTVWTSAGVTSGIDMALAMVEEDLGRPEALRLARSLVLYLKRPGGQMQFSDRLRQQIDSEDSRFAALVAWIDAHIGEDLSVERLADHMGMSPRSFARKCGAALGVSPAAFVERARVERACERLRQEDVGLKALARQCGFSSAEIMRRAFLRQVGIPPSEYQARFSPARVALEGAGETTGAPAADNRGS